MPTVLIAADWLHLQGSVVQFFIGYLTLEDEATVWSQTGPNKHQVLECTIPEE